MHCQSLSPATAPVRTPLSPQKPSESPDPAPIWYDVYIAKSVTGVVTGTHVWGAERQIDPALAWANVKRDPDVRADIGARGKVIEPGFEGRPGYSFGLWLDRLFKSEQVPLKEGAIGPDGARYSKGHLTYREEFDSPVPVARFLPDWIRDLCTKSGPLARALHTYETWLAPMIGMVGMQKMSRVRELDATISPDLRELGEVHVHEHTQVAGHRPHVLTDATFHFEHSTPEEFEARLEAARSSGNIIASGTK